MIITRLLIGTSALTGIALLFADSPTSDGSLTKLIDARPELGAVLLSVSMFIGLTIYMVRSNAREREVYREKDKLDRQERNEARAACHDISLKMTVAAERCADAAEKCVEFVEGKR